MQLVGVMTTAAFKQTGFGVRPAVRPAGSHSIAFVKLVQKNVAVLLLLDIIINPDLVFRHKFINVVVSAGRKIDIEHAANQTAIDKPALIPFSSFFQRRS